jgi:FkbM family methyltransferase
MPLRGMPGAFRHEIVKNQQGLYLQSRCIPVQERVKNLDLWQFLKQNGKPVIVYGTGDGADKLFEVLSYHGIEVAAVAASENFVRRRSFRGFEVEPIAAAIARLPGLPVLLAFGTRKREVLDYIYDLSERADVSLFLPDLPVAVDAQTPITQTLFDRQFADENRERLTGLRQFFADEKSRDVFDLVIEYKLTGKIPPLCASASDRDETFSLLRPGLKREDGDVFMDIGAFDGDTIQEFLDLTDNNYERIIAVEPDGRNLQKLLRRHSALSDRILIPVNAAACDVVGETTFHMGGGMQGRMGGDSTAGKHRKIIGSVTIDALAARFSPDKPITYINIDAEGAEAAVLRGAAMTIKRDKPQMIVAAYHRPRDILNLPEQILSLNPGYRLYLRRQECMPCWELNIIAV